MCFIKHLRMTTALHDTDSHANIDTDSCTEKVTMDVNGMALRCMLNGYRTHLSRSRSGRNSSEHYH